MLLEVRSLTLSADGRTGGSALTREPASWSLRRGEIACVRGPSGCGKSTLLRALADLAPVAGGTVLINGTDRDRIDAPEYRRRVVLVPAEPHVPGRTVGAAWRRPFEFAIGAPEFDGSRAAELAERCALPPGVDSWEPARLSSGERGRVALVRALLVEPQVLLLDEPTAALDARSRDAVESLLSDVAGEGLAVVLVTHDDDQPTRLGARVLPIRWSSDASVDAVDA